MQRLDISAIEAVVGKPIHAVTMKQIAALDDGCRRVLARSPIAGFGYRDEAGIPHTTFVGGEAGFVEVESAKRIVLREAKIAAKRGGGVSFVFMLPGIGDTLRLNGRVLDHQPSPGDRLVVGVEEAFVHCPKCILRSRLWQAPHPRRAAPAVAETGLLRNPDIADFLASSPFAVLSSWDARGASDTSPRGDPAGFVRVLDGDTIAIPDRKGNQRIDTFHNVVEDERVSLAAVVPGRPEVLHLHGVAWVTDHPELLATMAIKGKPAHLALCVRVLGAALRPNDALRSARPWDPRFHVRRDQVPDLMGLAAQHLAANEDTGFAAMLFRGIGRLLALFPAPVRRLMDKGLRSDLAKEGYDEAPRGLARRQVRVAAIRRETSDAVTLLLEDGGPFDFRAGQYFTLCVDIDGAEVRRAYSASSTPGETRLALTIKRVQGGLCSTYANERLREGDAVAILGPSGSFAIDPEASRARELVLLAGGSGITPIMSIARTVLAREPESRVAIVYGNRARADVVFAEVLDELRLEHGARLEVRHVLQHPPPDWRGGTGLLDEATLCAELARLASSQAAHYFVCGPEPMLQGALRAFAALAIPKERFHFERFSPPRRTANGPRVARKALPMIVARAGHPIGTVDVAPGKTLLEAGLAADLPMPFSCAMGNCGECRVRLASGEVEMDEPNSLAADERAQGYVLACVARPLCPVTIEIEPEEEAPE